MGDVEDLVEALEPLADVDEPLVVLTDEELYVVTAEAEVGDRLMPLEVFDQLEEPERSAVARTAYRSLVARGLVAPVEDPHLDRDRGLVELEVRSPLLTVLELLARPWPTVLAGNEVGGITTRRVLLTLGDRLVLEHEARGGFHRFSLFGAERGVVELAAFLDPAAAAGDQDGERLRGLAGDPPQAWRRLRAELDAADVNAQLLALRGPDKVPDKLLVELGVAGDQLLMITGEHPDERGEATEIAARTLSRASVLGLAAHALSLEGAVAASPTP